MKSLNATILNIGLALSFLLIFGCSTSMKMTGHEKITPDKQQ